MQSQSIITEVINEFISLNLSIWNVVFDQFSYQSNRFLRIKQLLCYKISSIEVNALLEILKPFVTLQKFYFSVADDSLH